ncbi:MAG TPA: hypothetical protein VGP89_09430 [Candidatus Angelobacter sp.]|jgi:hypothetical protein|nr:hypothetical protein [Candidatus Angelobacter sp.]
MPKAKSFPSLGERVAAAIASYNLGHTGVDRVLKQYAHVKVSDWWEKKARELQRESMENVDRKIVPKPGPERVH